MKLHPFLVGTIGCALLFSSCGPDRTTSNGGSEINSGGGPLLVQVPAERSGITFTNTLTESPEVNYFTYVYAYNGGGVAAGDINNDGLTDLYFTGNQVSDKLYLNKGGLKFEDITEKALGAKAKEGWRSGVSMADVNGDGWLDIYVCRSGPSRDTALTRNLFYQNNGDGTFTERAHALGIADTTHSTQAAFFDADKDGDLDLYVMNHPQGRVRGLSNLAAIKAVQDHVAPTDRFYRNEGGTFRDETYAAHVQNLAYSLGLAVSDLDQDGWPDVYEANDFDAPDLMYMNRRDGTFGDQLQFRTRHISNFGMGCDVADYNNDALPDIMVLDMTADDHKRNKTNMGSMSPDRFWANVRGGYFYQYMLNTLQLNNGNGTFSEVGPTGRCGPYRLELGTALCRPGQRRLEGPDDHQWLQARRAQQRLRAEHLRQVEERSRFLWNAGPDPQHQASQLPVPQQRRPHLRGQLAGLGLHGPREQQWRHLCGPRQRWRSGPGDQQPGRGGLSA